MTSSSSQTPIIYVVADDFTGAAETAGVALRYGLDSEVHTRFETDPLCEVVSLDSGSRHKTETESEKQIRKLGFHLIDLKSTRIFKKVDSVLRGWVLTEVRSLAACLKRDRTFLIPANPSLGRTVKDGRYYMGDRPIDRTEFADDPDHPVQSSFLVEMLRADLKSDQIGLAKPGSLLPEKGLLIGDVETSKDLSWWAKSLSDQTLAAGSAEFLAACLSCWVDPARKPEPVLSKPDHFRKTLFVSGSSSLYSRRLSKHFEKAGIPVHRMPADLLVPSSQHEWLLSQWSGQVLSSLKTHPCVRVSIDLPLQANRQTIRHLSECLTQVATTVLKDGPVDHVCVEGGATVSALVHRLGWSRFPVQVEWAPGVVSLQVPGRSGLLLTTKPGSYAWPSRLLPYK